MFSSNYCNYRNAGGGGYFDDGDVEMEGERRLENQASYYHKSQPELVRSGGRGHGHHPGYLHTYVEEPYTGRGRGRGRGGAYRIKSPGSYFRYSAREFDLNHYSPARRRYYSRPGCYSTYHWTKPSTSRGFSQNQAHRSTNKNHGQEFRAPGASDENRGGGNFKQQYRASGRSTFNRMKFDKERKKREEWHQLECNLSALKIAGNWDESAVLSGQSQGVTFNLASDGAVGMTLDEIIYAVGGSD